MHETILTDRTARDIITTPVVLPSTPPRGGHPPEPVTPSSAALRRTAPDPSPARRTHTTAPPGVIRAYQGPNPGRRSTRSLDLSARGVKFLCAARERGTAAPAPAAACHG